MPSVDFQEAVRDPQENNIETGEEGGGGQMVCLQLKALGRVIFLTVLSTIVVRSESPEILEGLKCRLRVIVLTITETTQTFTKNANLKVIPLKLFYYQTFLETWHN